MNCSFNLLRFDLNMLVSQTETKDSLTRISCSSELECDES